MLHLFGPKYTLIRKVITLVIAVVFFTSYVLTDAFSVVEFAEEIPFEMPEDTTFKGQYARLDPETFAIPAHLGEVKHSNKGTTERIIVHIQDAHCNYFAQNKIADIIDYLNKEYGIDIINLEGGSGEYDLSVFTSITGDEIRREVADYFVKKGEVNGAEYYAINNADKVTLWGIEDKDLYLENLKVYRDSLTYKEEVDKFLKELNHIFNNLKRHMFTPKLLDLVMKYNAYKAGNLSFREYLDFLIAKGKEEAIQIRKLPNLYLISQAMDEEDKIDFKKANRERGVLIDELKNRLSKEEMRELIAMTVQFKTKRISRKGYYSYLLKKSREVGINKDKFPALSSYIVYVSLFEAVDSAKVMDEIDKLEAELKEPLFRNDEERRLDVLSKNLALTQNIFDITLTKSDYKYYIDNKDAFKVQDYLTFIDKEAPKYKIAARPSENITRLDGHLDNISKFFEYSFKRDDAFLRNMRLGRIMEGTESAIMMTGGFHTENLCDLFKENNISYVSILPKFTSETDYESPYFELLAGQTTDLQRMLSSVIAQASMLQVASMLNKALADEVWGEAGLNAFQAEKVMRTMSLRLTANIAVEDADGNFVVAMTPQGEVVTSRDALRGMTYPLSPETLIDLTVHEEVKNREIADRLTEIEQRGQKAEDYSLSSDVDEVAAVISFLQGQVDGLRESNPEAAAQLEKILKDLNGVVSRKRLLLLSDLQDVEKGHAGTREGGSIYISENGTTKGEDRAGTIIHEATARFATTHATGVAVERWFLARGTENEKALRRGALEQLTKEGEMREKPLGASEADRLAMDTAAGADTTIGLAREVADARRAPYTVRIIEEAEEEVDRTRETAASASLRSYDEAWSEMEERALENVTDKEVEARVRKAIKTIREDREKDELAGNTVDQRRQAHMPHLNVVLDGVNNIDHQYILDMAEAVEQERAAPKPVNADQWLLHIFQQGHIAILNGLVTLSGRDDKRKEIYKAQDEYLKLIAENEDSLKDIVNPETLRKFNLAPLSQRAYVDFKAEDSERPFTEADALKKAEIIIQNRRMYRAIISAAVDWRNNLEKTGEKGDLAAAIRKAIAEAALTEEDVQRVIIDEAERELAQKETVSVRETTPLKADDGTLVGRMTYRSSILGRVGAVFAAFFTVMGALNQAMAGEAGTGVAVSVAETSRGLLASVMNQAVAFMGANPIISIAGAVLTILIGASLIRFSVRSIRAGRQEAPQEVPAIEIMDPNKAFLTEESDERYIDYMKETTVVVDGLLAKLGTEQRGVFTDEEVSAILDRLKNIVQFDFKDKANKPGKHRILSDYLKLLTLRAGRISERNLRRIVEILTGATYFKKEADRLSTGAPEGRVNMTDVSMDVADLLAKVVSDKNNSRLLRSLSNNLLNFEIDEIDEATGSNLRVNVADMLLWSIILPINDDERIKVAEKVAPILEAIINQNPYLSEDITDQMEKLNPPTKEERRAKKTGVKEGEGDIKRYVRSTTISQRVYQALNGKLADAIAKAQPWVNYNKAWRGFTAKIGELIRRQYPGESEEAREARIRRASEVVRRTREFNENFEATRPEYRPGVMRYNFMFMLENMSNVLDEHGINVDYFDRLYLHQPSKVLEEKAPSNFSEWMMFTIYEGHSKNFEHLHLVQNVSPEMAIKIVQKQTQLAEVIGQNQEIMKTAALELGDENISLLKLAIGQTQSTERSQDERELFKKIRDATLNLKSTWANGGLVRKLDLIPEALSEKQDKERTVKGQTVEQYIAEQSASEKKTSEEWINSNKERQLREILNGEVARMTEMIITAKAIDAWQKSGSNNWNELVESVLSEFKLYEAESTLTEERQRSRLIALAQEALTQEEKEAIGVLETYSRGEPVEEQNMMKLNEFLRENDYQGITAFDLMMNPSRAEDLMNSIIESRLPAAPEAAVAHKYAGTEMISQEEFNRQKMRVREGEAQTVSQAKVGSAVQTALTAERSLLSDMLDLLEGQGIITSDVRTGIEKRAREARINIVTLDMQDLADSLSWRETDGSLTIVLNSNAGKSDKYLEAPDTTLLAHMLRHEFLEGIMGVSHTDIKYWEMLHNNGDGLTALNQAAIGDMTLAQLLEIKPEHSADPKGTYYQAILEELNSRAEEMTTADIMKELNAIGLMQLENFFLALDENNKMYKHVEASLESRLAGEVLRLIRQNNLTVIALPVTQDMLLFNGNNMTKMKQMIKRLSRDYGFNLEFVYYEVDQDGVISGESQAKLKEDIKRVKGFATQDNARCAVAGVNQRQHDDFKGFLNRETGNKAVLFQAETGISQEYNEQQASIRRLVITGKSLADIDREEGRTDRAKLLEESLVEFLRFVSTPETRDRFTVNEKEGKTARAILEALVNGEIVLDMRPLTGEIPALLEADEAVRISV